MLNLNKLYKFSRFNFNYKKVLLKSKIIKDEMKFNSNFLSKYFYFHVKNV